MSDRDCVELLRWALPKLGMQWTGFRKVRGQVCKRIRSRVAALELADIASYRSHLELDPSEWAVLDGLCRVTISRFFRDKGTFRHLTECTLPRLARSARAGGRTHLRAWSAGCASGEEPYSLALAWRFGVAPREPGIQLEVLSTDIDPVLLDRASRACYPRATLRDLPESWRGAAFEEGSDEDQWYLVPPFTEGVSFERRDVRHPPPSGPFDVILCRNLALTYFEEARQVEVLRAMLGVLRDGGALVIGAHETLPPGAWPLTEEAPGRQVFRRINL